jgi:maltose alpha-D-glucosyltransferase / alpha-amylase
MAGTDPAARLARAAAVVAHTPPPLMARARTRQITAREPKPKPAETRSEPGHWFERDPLWFKHAVFYEIHIRGFFDSDDDGSGDLRGIQDKLDFLQWLGIDCIWLLPFYASPLRDGGYDVADFYTVHRDYGNVEDFAALVEAAHRRGIRIIADFVVNHTSSDHEWFQQSRSDPDGPYGDYYVWSDTDERWQEARIIFLDTEPSNWTWDPVRGQYYWHRFFSHQPDLNYRNPEVQEAILTALRFWLDLGIDGFRLDAVPYLYEADGTNGENLPETHEFLKRIRAEVDASYTDRVLLAEANQWPGDVVDYFGDGDECHMAFHFPVMPRMFMSLRREEATPMYEILRQTPLIPDNCQWGLFLRNHDELTLEMVTDEERDYMYSEYAKDPRMKLNLGIRRRLAPLLDNGRDEIELMHAIMCSLPGSPVLYYGDEIGMGDNIYLGDRDGVRTPMQWTGDRNAGFSRADFAQLYLPPLMDPVYGFQACNVEAHLRTPTSLLRWIRRLIELRKQHPVFGLGTYEALITSNPRVFAHIRTYEDDVVLCVHNLARSAQAVELDLSWYEGWVPEEMFGRTKFPRIGELPYLLTLTPRGFFWFQLQKEEEQS